MLVSRKFTRKQKFILGVLCLNEFLYTVALSMLAPIYPKEIAERGGDDIIAGLIFGFYSFISFLVAPIVGKLAPTFRISTTMTTGIIISGVSNLLFGSIEAIGGTTLVTTSSIVLSESFPTDVGFSRGILEVFMSGGLCLGPAIGAVLYSLAGLQIPFFCLGITMILATPLNMHLLHTQKNQGTEIPSKIFWKVLKIPTVLMSSLSILVSAISWTFIDPVLEPHLRKYDLCGSCVGLIFLFTSTVYIVVCPIVGWLSDKKPNYKWHMMIFGIIVMVLSLLLLGPTTIQSFLKESLYTSMLALALLDASSSFAFIPAYQCSIEAAIENGFQDDMVTQSVVSSIWMSSYSFGTMIGPIVAGLLYNKWGFAVMTDVFACSFFGVVVIICCQRLYSEVRAERKQNLDFVNDEFNKKDSN